MKREAASWLPGKVGTPLYSTLGGSCQAGCGSAKCNKPAQWGAGESVCAVGHWQAAPVLSRRSQGVHHVLRRLGDAVPPLVAADRPRQLRPLPPKALPQARAGVLPPAAQATARETGGLGSNLDGLLATARRAMPGPHLTAL